MEDQRRRKRRDMRFLQREATWLQKALFALGKAEEAREKLADGRDEASPEYVLEVEGQRLPMEELEDALEQRVKELLEALRELRRQVP